MKFLSLVILLTVSAKGEVQSPECNSSFGLSVSSNIRFDSSADSQLRRRLGVLRYAKFPMHLHAIEVEAGTLVQVEDGDFAIESGSKTRKFSKFGFRHDDDPFFNNRRDKLEEKVRKIWKKRKAKSKGVKVFTIRKALSDAFSRIETLHTDDIEIFTLSNENIDRCMADPNLGYNIFLDPEDPETSESATHFEGAPETNSIVDHFRRQILFGTSRPPEVPRDHDELYSIDTVALRPIDLIEFYILFSQWRVQLISEVGRTEDLVDEETNESIKLDEVYESFYEYHGLEKPSDSFLQFNIGVGGLYNLTMDRRDLYKLSASDLYKKMNYLFKVLQIEHAFIERYRNFAPDLSLVAQPMIDLEKSDQVILKTWNLRNEREMEKSLNQYPPFTYAEYRRIGFSKNGEIYGESWGMDFYPYEDYEEGY